MFVTIIKFIALIVRLPKTCHNTSTLSSLSSHTCSRRHQHWLIRSEWPCFTGVRHAYSTEYSSAN